MPIFMGILSAKAAVLFSMFAALYFAAAKICKGHWVGNQPGPLGSKVEVGQVLLALLQSGSPLLVRVFSSQGLLLPGSP